MIKRELIKKADKIFREHLWECWLNEVETLCFICNHLNGLEVGHYESRSHHLIRYDEVNCHLICRSCNMKQKIEGQNGKTAQLYKEKIIEKYGINEFNRILSLKNKKITVEELLNIIERYENG